MNNRTEFERFAVQYWGQHVQKYKGTDINLYPINEDLKEGDLHKSFLELRSIESLTDAQRANLADITGLYQDDYLIEAILHNTRYVINWQVIQPAIDYLRSIGILVPFDKYSVEQILEMGWAVIADNQNK